MKTSPSKKHIAPSTKVRDPLHVNKISAGVLTALLIMLSGVHLMNALFSKPDLAQNSVVIDTSALENTQTQTSSIPAGPDPIIELLASADPVKGEKIFRLCMSCHTASEGGPNRVGPNLWNIVSRDAARIDNFKYSKALTAYAESGGVWDFESLNRYLFSPLVFFDGTRGNMNFIGVKRTQDRANLIRFLREQSPDPAVLP